MQALRLACLLATLGSTAAHAGLFDDEEARRQIADLKAKSEARFDQQSHGQLELSSQLSRQVEEIARLRGQVETLLFELETAKKRQQDFYIDLDSRLRKLEPQIPATGGDSATAPDAPVADPAVESQAYEAALGQFKAGKYKDAATSFATFVQTYPNGALAPNAQFWLANSWYAQRNCAKAIEAHGVVTTKYPESDKAPDAWLGMATCQQDMGNAAAARRSLEALVAKYPQSPAADTARQRLKKK